MVDAGNALRDTGVDATSDAAAQSDCATCTAGAMRVTTAATDSAQQVQGRVRNTTSVNDVFFELGVGPAILTDLMVSGFTTEVFLSSTGCNSAGQDSGQLVIAVTQSSPVRGARFVAPAGSSFCAAVGGDDELYWSGYRLYE
jgi:hypothetical protein